MHPHAVSISVHADASTPVSDVICVYVCVRACACVPWYCAVMCAQDGVLEIIFGTREYVAFRKSMLGITLEKVTNVLFWV